MSFKTSDQYEEEGVGFYDAQRYEQSLEVFQQGLACFPGDADLRLGCGMARIKLGDYPQACAILEGLRRDGLLLSEALQGLSEAYLCLGRKADALECVAAASGAERKDPDYIHSLGLMLFRHNFFEEAARVHRRALAFAPGHAPSQLGLGVCLHRLGDRQGAVACLRKAVEADPGCWEAYSYLGNLLFDLGRRKEAKEAMEIIPVWEISDPTTLKRLAVLCGKGMDAQTRRQLELRRAEVERARSQDSASGLLSALGRRLAEAERAAPGVSPGAFSADERLDAAFSRIFGVPAEGPEPRRPLRFDRRLCEEALEALAGFIEAARGRGLENSGLADALLYGAAVAAEMRRRFRPAVFPAASVGRLEAALSRLEASIPVGSKVQEAWTGLIGSLRG